MSIQRKKNPFGVGAQQAGGSGINIAIEDGVIPFSIIMSKNFKSILGRVIRHIGFEIHDRVKRYMKKDEHGKGLSRIQASRVVDRHRGYHRDITQSRGFRAGQRLKNKDFAGDLNQQGKSMMKAVRYGFNPNTATAVVGLASKSARRMFSKYFQEGTTSTVTTEMRRFFFFMARRAKNMADKEMLMSIATMKGNTIQVPKRPIFDPVYAKIKGSIPRLMEQRFKLHLDEIDEVAYQEILKNEMGINDMIRNADKFAERVKRQQERRSRATRKAV